jgi:tRNA threonylcarbamoyladenosine biosynthesis protein TsaE
MNLNWSHITQQELYKVATEILAHQQSKKIAFFGDLGAGKTTLIKELSKEIGVDTIVSSPTFTLLNEYHGKSATIYHFDFYRIKEPKEIYELGFEEYFYSDNYVFIEWPENIKDLLPAFFSKIFISVNEKSTRNIIWDV